MPEPVESGVCAESDSGEYDDICKNACDFFAGVKPVDDSPQEITLAEEAQYSVDDGGAEIYRNIYGRCGPYRL